MEQSYDSAKNDFIIRRQNQEHFQQEIVPRPLIESGRICPPRPPKKEQPIHKMVPPRPTTRKPERTSSNRFHVHRSHTLPVPRARNKNFARDQHIESERHHFPEIRQSVSSTDLYQTRDCLGRIVREF